MKFSMVVFATLISFSYLANAQMYTHEDETGRYFSTDDDYYSSRITDGPNGRVIEIRKKNHKKNKRNKHNRADNEQNCGVKLPGFPCGYIPPFLYGRWGQYGNGGHNGGPNGGLPQPGQQPGDHQQAPPPSKIIYYGPEGEELPDWVKDYGNQGTIIDFRNLFDQTELPPWGSVNEDQNSSGNHNNQNGDQNNDNQDQNNGDENYNPGNFNDSDLDWNQNNQEHLPPQTVPGAPRVQPHVPPSTHPSTPPANNGDVSADDNSNAGSYAEDFPEEDPANQDPSWGSDSSGGSSEGE